MTAPPRLRGASLSVATKVFLGFAVVIAAFGATCTYTLLTMGELRRTVTVVWKEVIPISNQLKTLSRQLKNAEEFLALKRPSDLQWIQNILPSIEPFKGPQGLQNAATRLDALATGGEALTAADRRELATIGERLTAFSTGRALADAISGEGVDDLLAPDAPLASEELYERLLRKTLKKASLGELTSQAPEARASVRALRRLNRELSEQIRALAAPIEALDRRVSDDERRATLYVLVIASGALLLSLAMLWITLRTLRPIQRLRAGARRIAAGDYQERVSVSSRDEIGQLALEFNTMAESLQNRDAELERQREALLRAERLAIIGKLAAQITHEVRNPLSSIGLNAELLEDELDELSDPTEARASLRAINAEVQRLKSITEEYLHFARLPKPELRSVDTGRLLMEFLTFIARELEAARVELRTRGVAASLDGGPPPIRADGDQLRQALLNIARNAIDALAGVDGPRTLEVALEPRGGAGGVRITLTDNGPGIDAAIRARIFDPFVTGKPNGTGLGLALTQEIIAEHGGQVRVVSPVRDERGTAFVIELPPDARPGVI